MIKLNKFTILNCGFTFINPVLGIFVFLLTLGRKEVYPAFCFSLALIYVYFPIPWDSRSTFYRIYVYPEEGLNLYASLSMYLNELFGLQYITVVFIYTFLMFYLWTKVFFSSCYRNKTILISISIFLLYVSFFEYRQVMDLQRISLAFTIFLFAIVVVRSKLLKVFLVILSIAVHYLLAAFLFVYMVKNVNLINRSVYVLLLISFILGITGEVILSNYLELLSAYIPERVYIYLSIVESKFSSPTSKYIVYSVRLAFMFIALLIFKPYLREHKSKDGMLSFYYLMSCLCFAFIFNEVFFERFHIFLTMLAAVIAVKIHITQREIIILTLAILLSFSMNAISNYSIFFSERYEGVIHDSPRKMEMAYKPIYLPTFFLLNFEENGYSNEFIFKVTK